MNINPTCPPHLSQNIWDAAMDDMRGFIQDNPTYEGATAFRCALIDDVDLEEVFYKYQKTEGAMVWAWIGPDQNTYMVGFDPKV